MKKLIKRYLLFTLVSGTVAFFILYWGFHVPFEKYRTVYLLFPPFIALYPTFMVTIGLQSRSTWERLEAFEKELADCETLPELEAYIDTLREYRNSMHCFGVVHMKEANKLIYAAKVKKGVIEKLSNPTTSL